MKKRPKTYELEGRVFYSFTVLFKGDRVGCDQYWACKCQCGNTRFIPSSKLLSGKRKHCGCLKPDRYKDLTRQNFGRLFVKEILYRYSGRIYWECICDCGESVKVEQTALISDNTQSCGCLRKELLEAKISELHPSWKGGRVVGNEGYIHITVNGEYVREHRYIMEQSIGRKLYSYETVHHKDGNKENNHIANLELWVSRHPRGQRVSDLIEYAQNILMQYKPELLRKNLNE